MYSRFNRLFMLNCTPPPPPPRDRASLYYDQTTVKNLVPFVAL